jgi:hypothetical protein
MACRPVPARRLWPRLAVLSATVFAVVAAPATARSSVAASAAPTPEMFYTTNSPAALRVVAYQADGDRIRVGTSKVVTSLPGADGLAFAPDGDLLVGGGRQGAVFKVNPKTGAFTSQPSGIPTAFHVSVSPDGARAWTAGLPGKLASLPLKPFGPGTAGNVQGDDQFITTIGFTPGRAFYTSSDSFGSGNFGTIDLTTMRTKRWQVGLRGAHGFAYDPFTKDIFLFGSYAIVQIDPAHPDVVISERSVPGMSFDQGTVDGHGHLLAASNSGYLVLIDYAASGLVGDTGTAKNPSSKAFLDANLDDISPNGTLTVTSSGAGSGGGTSSTKKLLPIIGLVLLVAIVVGFLLNRQSRTGVESPR